MLPARVASVLQQARRSVIFARRLRVQPSKLNLHRCRLIMGTMQERLQARNFKPTSHNASILQIRTVTLAIAERAGLRDAKGEFHPAYASLGAKRGTSWTVEGLERRSEIGSRLPSAVEVRDGRNGRSAIDENCLLRRVQILRVRTFSHVVDGVSKPRRPGYCFAWNLFVLLEVPGPPTDVHV
jgi:hypothetical protein